MKVKDFLDLVLVILGIKQDDLVGFKLIHRVAKYLCPNYKLTWPELAWFYDKRLNSILAKFGEEYGFNAHRRLALQELLRLTENIEGDTAECGVYKGCGSYIILLSNMKSRFRRIHHIFDSFEGLSSPNPEKDGSYWRQSSLSIDEQTVKCILSDFHDVKYYKGWIPSRFGEVSSLTFSFVHIDVDLYEPTYESIRFFYDRMNAGGIIVCDDYGFLTCPGATAAIDEFLANKVEKMVRLPGGGGFFIKGVVTSL